MTVERLSDFLGSAYDKFYLQRIFLAQKLEKELLTLSKEKIKVVIRRKSLVFYCSNSAQAAFLRLKRREIYGIMKRSVPVLYAQNLPIQFRVQYSANGPAESL